MKISMVIDIGFGDSGKGVAVDYLAKQQPEQSLVVRFSGGHQVGHTVTVGDFSHTFSHFGSGTLRGVPTYYTADTTVFPIGVAAEYERIRGRISDTKPLLIYHPLSMVTTPYDIAFNRARERHLRHGSCGVGFGATVDRHSDGITLYVMDLQQRWVFSEKLKAIKNYYLQKLAKSECLPLFQEELAHIDDEIFMRACREMAFLYTIADFQRLDKSYKHLIFEGSQGIMLDQVHGIFPHVTRSFTTSKNAMAFLREQCIAASKVDMYYVTRSYQTRHGNGPMSSTQAVELRGSENEANQTNEFQGEFRTAKLDPSLLAYAIGCDRVYHGRQEVCRHLVVSCLDQRPDFDAQKLLDYLAQNSVLFDSCVGGYSPDSKDWQPLDGAGKLGVGEGLSAA